MLVREATGRHVAGVWGGPAAKRELSAHRCPVGGALLVPLAGGVRQPLDERFARLARGVKLPRPRLWP